MFFLIKQQLSHKISKYRKNFYRRGEYFSALININNFKVEIYHALVATQGDLYIIITNKQ